MKLLHVPFCFYPDPVGGTEIYVESLALRQQQRGVAVEIAAGGGKDDCYTHNGLPVHRFAVNNAGHDLRDFYGEGDRTAAAGFARILKRTAPDIVHLHAWTSGVSLRLLRTAKSAGIPVVFTYHTPTVSCVRGTLLRWGSEICDGDIETSPCTACMLQGKGLSLTVSWTLGKLPTAVGQVIGKAGLSGGVWTAIRASELMALRRDAFHKLLAEADHVIAVCDWVRDLLIRNHADPRKLTLSRQGLRESVNPGGRRHRNTGAIRMAFLGRVERIKGIDILIEAMRRVETPRLQLDIYGVVQGAEGHGLQETLSRLIAGDSRIRFLPALAPGDVMSTLDSYDLLAVPSQWLETGPLVVYEAFAAGLPVLGSDLGGIAELVRHDHNGLLVEPASVEAWARALRRLVDEPDLLPRLESGIPSVRTMDTVADEMHAVYSTLRRTTFASEPVTSICGPQR